MAEYSTPSPDGDDLRKAAIVQAGADETNHRAANSFQIIGSLVARRARRTPSAEVRAELLAIGTAVGAMELAHRHLYVRRAGTLDLRGYLRDLLGAIATYAQLCGDCKVQFDDTAHDHVAVAPQVAIRLGMIVSELLTNSIKHAGPAATCRASVTVEGARLIVEISDTGPGFACLPGPTSGLKLVAGIAASLEASFCFIAGPDGPRFLIELPMSAAAGASVTIAL